MVRGIYSEQTGHGARMVDVGGRASERKLRVEITLLAETAG
jgi:hypothetical protein